MKRFSLTPAARADLIAITEHIAKQSPGAALMVHARLRAACRRLAENPGVGHARSDLAAESLAVYVVHSYVIVYRRRTRPLQIIRVLHGARDVGAIVADD